MSKLRIQDRVEIKIPIFLLKHRKRPLYGRITNIDGSYIMVSPMWCKWEIELYPCEIEKTI